MSFLVHPPCWRLPQARRSPPPRARPSLAEPPTGRGAASPPTWSSHFTITSTCWTWPATNCTCRCTGARRRAGWGAGVGAGRAELQVVCGWNGWVGLEGMRVGFYRKKQAAMRHSAEPSAEPVCFAPCRRFHLPRHLCSQPLQVMMRQRGSGKYVYCFHLWHAGLLEQ